MQGKLPDVLDTASAAAALREAQLSASAHTYVLLLADDFQRGCHPRLRGRTFLRGLWNMGIN